MVMDVRQDSKAANPLGFTVFTASGEQLTIVAKNLNQVRDRSTSLLLLMRLDACLEMVSECGDSHFAMTAEAAVDGRS